MDAIYHWLFINIVGPLMLPLLVVASLCMIADVKPEPVLQAFYSMFGAIIAALFNLISLLVKTISYWCWRIFVAKRG